MPPNSIHTQFSRIYFFFYFGIGAILPLYALYLASIGLSGTQIGTLTATGSFIGIFSGPVWGYISDRLNRHKLILMCLMIGVSISAFLITITHHISLLFIIIIFYYSTLSPINPLLDGITLHLPVSFGKVRLWGSIGFAVAAYVTGFIAHRTSLIIIFYLLILSMFLSVFFLKKTRIAVKHSDAVDLKQLWHLLTDRKFLNFLIFGMLITSTIGGMNIYFSLYFQSIGGNLSLIGLAFLLFALSEVPAMHLVAVYMAKHGPYKLLAIVPFLGILRWGLYSLNPSPLIILSTFALQGLFYGPMLVGAAEYIRRELPANLRTTGMALYTSVGFGLGGVFINYLSGYLYDHYAANTIFIAYTLLCAMALLFVPYLYKTRTRY